MALRAALGHFNACAGDIAGNVARIRRYEKKSTMMTSNRPLENWGKLLGEVPSATAILDRFLHHAQIISITGRSYHLKDKAPKEKADPEKKGQKDHDSGNKRK